MTPFYSCRRPLATAMDGGSAGNAGAFFRPGDFCRWRSFDGLDMAGFSGLEGPPTKAWFRGSDFSRDWKCLRRWRCLIAGEPALTLS